MPVDPNDLNSVLEQPIDVQVAVIATQQHHNTKKLDTLCKKVDGLVAWKIKVVAIASTLGTVIGVLADKLLPL